MSFFYKFIGKVVTYLGILVGVNGIVHGNLGMKIMAVVVILVGSYIHERNEK